MSIAWRKRCAPCSRTRIAGRDSPAPEFAVPEVGTTGRPSRTTRCGRTRSHSMGRSRAFGKSDDRRRFDRGGARVTPDADDADELDESGVPDLEGPLPEKAATGDPQEGLPPPSERPHSFDWGTTDAEQRAGEPLSLRTEHERPEVADNRGSGAPTDDEDDVVL